MAQQSDRETIASPDGWVGRGSILSRPPSRLGLVVALLLVSSSCTRAFTQLVPVVQSDLAPSQIRCVVAEAGPVAVGGPFVATSSPRVFYVGAEGEPRVTLPFSFGLTPPGGDWRARVELRVSALSACNDLESRTVSRSVRSGFLPDQSLALPIRLAASCAGVVCDEGLTCDEGTCVAIPVVDPASLAPVTPGMELGLDGGAPRAEDAAPDGGGNDPVGPGTLSRVLTPMWAASGGALFEFPGSFSLIGLADDDVVVGGRTNVAGTFAGASVEASRVVIARLRPDGSLRWARSLTTPASDLALQSYRAASAVLVRTAAAPRLYVCGTVGREGLSDPETGRSWRARGISSLTTDTWIASLDPETGTLGRVVTLTARSDGEEVDTFCKLTSTTGRDVVAALALFNAPTANVDAITWDEGTLPLEGGPYRPNFGVLVDLDPRFDAPAADTLATRVLPLPGAAELFLAPDGAAGLVLAASGFTEPGPPLATTTPATSPTAVIARMAPDGSISWRNRVVGDRAHATVSGLAVSAGRAVLSIRSSPSMTTGPYGLTVGTDGSREPLDWADGADERAVTMLSLDLATGAVASRGAILDAMWVRVTASDASGDVLALGPLFSGEDVGFGRYTASGTSDMVLLRLGADLSLRWHVEWTSDAATGDELSSARIAPSGAAYVAGATALGGTARLTPSTLEVSGAFVTRL